MSPRRIQLRRTAGWRKPAGAVVVARPGQWGNPWRVDRLRDPGTIWVTYSLGTDDVVEYWTAATMREGQELAVAAFERALHAGELLVTVDEVRTELAGRDLCCWCPPGPCHADVLLEVANP